MARCFVSHASPDASAALVVADALREAGHDVFLDVDRQDGIAPGRAWQQELFRELRLCDVVVFLDSAAAQASHWCHLELANAVDQGKPIYVASLEPGGPRHPLVQHVQSLPGAGDPGSAGADLAAALARDGFDAGSSSRWDPTRSPYPGLAAFEVADAAVYFGRDDEVRSVLNRVEAAGDGGVVTVAGASGVGKSSLLRAGVAARLARRTRSWVVAPPFEPGPYPLDRLAHALATATDDEVPVVRAAIESGHLARLALSATDAADGARRRLLVVVDQVEQLVDVTEQAERDRFLSVLDDALSAGAPLTVVLGVRADQLAAAQRLGLLGARIADPYVLRPLDGSTLARVIEEPAHRADLALEPGLSARLVQDVQGRDGDGVLSLPLLSFTLRAMYERVAEAGRRTITHDDYEAVGRIDGAIRQSAEAAESGVDAEQLATVLGRFVALGDGRTPVGRPVPGDEIGPDDAEVLDRLRRHRLVVDDQGAVRLCHERLFTAWPTLAAIVEQREADLVLARQLEQAADRWTAGGSTLNRLEVRQASELMARGRAGLTDDVPRLLEASRRRNRRERGLRVGALVALVALVVASAALASSARRAQDTAEERAAEQSAIRLAAQADVQAARDPELAVLLAREAFAVVDVPETRGALARSLQAWDGDRASTELIGHVGAVTSADWSDDGRLATIAHDGIRIWDVETGESDLLPLEDPGFIERGDVAWGPDGRLASGREQLLVWDTETGESREVGQIPGPVTGLDWSPDGRLASAHEGSVVVWDVDTGDRTDLPLPVPAQRVGDPVVAWGPNGSLASAGNDQGIRIWDVETGRARLLLPEPESEFDTEYVVDTLAWGPADPLAASGAGEATRIWDVAAGTSQFRDEDRSASSVAALAWGPNGTLAGGQFDGPVRVWDADATRSREYTGHEEGVLAVAFAPDGALASVSRDSTVRIWSIEAATARPELEGHAGSIGAMARSADGRLASGGGADRSVLVWDIDAERFVELADDIEIGPDELVGVEDLAWSPRGDLASVSADARLRVWSGASGTAQQVPVEDARIAVAWSVGDLIAAASSDGPITIWDSQAEAAGQRLAGHEGIVEDLDWSTDGHLASGGADASVRVWDLATGAAAVLTGHTERVRSVGWSPRGELASGGDDGTVRLWNPDDGSSRSLGNRNRQDAVAAVAWSDGNRLASLHIDNTVRVWDLGSATEWEVVSLDSEVYATSLLWTTEDQLAVSTDDRITLVSCYSCMAAADLLDVAGEVDRELTPAERAQFDVPA